MDLQTGVVRLLMPDTYKIGQHWTGRVAATELAMSSCDADCILMIERDRLEVWNAGRRASGVFGFDRHVLDRFPFQITNDNAFTIILMSHYSTLSDHTAALSP